jgi:methionyl-tRNA formyltransferase
MGTPQFAVPCLEMIINEKYHIAAVVTQPDKPQGRKQLLTPSPVKLIAQANQLHVMQPIKLRNSEIIEIIRQFQPDLIITAAYGQILPKEMLQIPRLGCINVHASLLPKYRGGAPIHYAVMRGDVVTGITIMYMNEGLDTGDMISQCQVPITIHDTTGTMFEKLSIAGALLLKETLPKLFSGDIQVQPQNHAEAIYAPNIQRDDERINWKQPALEIYNQIRGLNPFPGAYTLWRGETMKIWASTLVINENSLFKNTEQDGEPFPGMICAISKSGIDVCTGQGILRLTVIQPAGKKSMTVEQWIQGSTMKIGEKFEIDSKTNK